MNDTPVFTVYYAMDNGVVDLLQKILQERYVLWECLVNRSSNYIRAHFTKSDSCYSDTNSITFGGGHDSHLIFRPKRAQKDLELVFGVADVRMKYSGLDDLPMLHGGVELKSFMFTDRYRDKPHKGAGDHSGLQYPDNTRMVIFFNEHIKEINIWGMSHKGFLFNLLENDDPEEEPEGYEADLYVESYLTFHFENINTALCILGGNISLEHDFSSFNRPTGWNLDYQILRTLRPE